MGSACSSLLHLWLAFISIVLLSCDKPQPEAIRLLTVAEQLADNHPISFPRLNPNYQTGYYRVYIAPMQQ